MKLDDLNSFGKDLNRTKLVYGLITIIAVGALPIMYWINLQTIQEVTGKVIVIDQENRQYKAERRRLTKAEREAQYVAQAKEVWFLLWNLDKGNFDVNINSALELTGESGEKLYEDYFVERRFEQLIKESNYRSENRVLDCTVDMNRTPVTGVIRSVWTIERPGGSDKRNLHATFKVRDVGISHKNPLGVEIDALDIFDNSRVVENQD